MKEYTNDSFKICYSTTVDDEMICVCLRHMLVTESATIFITDKEIERIFYIDLIAIVKSEPMWKMDHAALYIVAKDLKEIGTNLYKEGQHLLAFEKFRFAAQHIIPVKPYDEDDGVEFIAIADQLRVQIFSNLSLCQFKVQNFEGTVFNCTEVLDTDESNLKSLFRRGEAYRRLGLNEASFNDLRKALQLDPTNESVKKSLKISKDNLKNEQAELSKSMSKMFS